MGSILHCTVKTTESYAYRLPEEKRNSWTELKQAMENRFDNRALKRAKYQKSKCERNLPMKSLEIKVSDIEDLYRKTYQDKLDFIKAV